MNLQEENLNLQEENAQPTEITKKIPPFFPTKGGLELKTTLRWEKWVLLYYPYLLEFIYFQLLSQFH